jgi:hypothetical protein
MKLAYGLLIAFVVAFGILWALMGDPVGAAWALIVLAIAGALLAAVIVYVVSNAPHWLRWARGITDEQHLAQLEATGKAVRERYRMNRALTFEDLATGCLVHVIDLGDGRLLCLYGQDYYGFEPHHDEPEDPQPRRFPTTEFSLLRDARSRAVLALTPGTQIVEPTQCAAIAKPNKLHDLGIRLEDGELISGLAFDTVERALR